MSFRDWINNRLFRKRAQADFEAFQNIRSPKNPSRRHIDWLVEQLLTDEHARAAERELGMIGPAAVPSLAAALRDPRYHQEIKRSHVMINQPLEMLLALLEPHAPEEVHSAAITLARSPSSDIRKTAALYLASLGREDTIPLLAQLLNDEDGYVRSYVVMGVQSALKAGRCSANFRASMYDLLLAQCDQQWKGAMNDAAEAVIALDAARAAVDFASARWLSPSNRNVAKLVTECNRAGILLPEDLLRGLLDHSLPLAVGEKCYPHEYVVAAALVAVTMKIGVEARPLLERALVSDQDEIQEAAAQGLAKLAGVNEPVEFVLERIGQVGFEGLSPPQQVIFCCHLFDAEVCNGGIMQFFGNSSGDLAVETLDALRVIGHAEAENALETAMRLIGPLARESNRDDRMEAFENRYDELRTAFDPLDRAYYRTNGLFRQRMLLYAAAHPEHFRRGAEQAC